MLRDFKRHTSRAISREATKQGRDDYVQAFAAARSSFRSGRAEYQVWQEGSHPEAIYDDDFARQKIEYIHNNPVKAGLAGKAEEWPYSSTGISIGRGRRIRRRILWTYGDTRVAMLGWQLHCHPNATGCEQLLSRNASGFRSPARSLSS